MYTFEDAGGRSQTLRPEGTAPVARAYLEHGMHKAPQPVKLWYLSSFFRQEKPQAGRFRQFWQIGAEAIGSADPAVDAELILLLHAILTEIGVRDVQLRLSSLGTPGGALRVPRATCRTTSARTRTSLSARSASASTSTRCARSTPTTPARSAVMESAPRLLDHLDADDAAHFAEVRALLDAAGDPVRDRHDPRARDGLLHPHGVRVRLRRARRAVGGRRRRPLRRPHRDDRRPADARATAGRPGSSACCSPPSGAPEPQPVVDLYVASAKRDNGRATAFALAAEARRAGLAVQQELAGPLAEGPAQAGRPDRRPLRCDPRRRGRSAQGHGVGRAGDRGVGSGRGRARALKGRHPG